MKSRIDEGIKVKSKVANKFCKCKLCGKYYTSVGIRDHLKKTHTKEYEEMLKQFIEE